MANEPQNEIIIDDYTEPQTVQVTEPPVDCKCEGDVLINEARQKRAFVQSLKNPVVLEYIHNRSEQHWTAPYKVIEVHEGRRFERGRVRVYKAGGRIKYICVHEDDVENLIGRVLANSRVFRRWSPINAELAKQIAISNQNPARPNPTGGVLDTRAVASAAVAITDFSDIEGIGKTTAVKLVGAGYTLESLAEYDSGDEAIVLEVAHAASISKPLVVRAILGARGAIIGVEEVGD